jgi:hypothetical protein
MKKIFSVLLAAGLMVAACKSKKVVSGSANEPTETQLTALKTKMPDATMNDLKQGHSIYYGACTKCHGAKDVSGYTEEKLRKVINKMAGKAALTEPETEAVWKYALALNLSAQK